MAPAAHFTALSEEIDQLLAHYLELLDQYTTLRSQLSVLQSSVSVPTVLLNPGQRLMSDRSISTFHEPTSPPKEECDMDPTSMTLVFKQREYAVSPPRVRLLPP